MKKNFKFFSLILAVLLALSMVTTAAARTYWTGDPDPMACNNYKDCGQVIPVCIGGQTYEIGIYPALYEASDETIVAAAFSYSETVLTVGACVSTDVVYIPHMDLFLSVEGFGLAPDPEIVHYCILESSTAGPVSIEILAAHCLIGDKAGLGVSALPKDLTNPTCSAPVTAPAGLGPGQDVYGTWACDSLLKNIKTEVVGRTITGHRMWLFRADPFQKQSLWYVYVHNPWLAP